MLLDFLQLGKLLSSTPTLYYSLKGKVVFFEGLFKHWHAEARENVEAFCNEHQKTVALRAFLLSQSVETLEKLFHDVVNVTLKSTIGYAWLRIKAYRG